MTRTTLYEAIKHSYHTDQKALDVARHIDNLYVRSWHSPVQRTSAIQIAISEALTQWVGDAIQRNNIPEDNFK